MPDTAIEERMAKSKEKSLANDLSCAEMLGSREGGLRLHMATSVVVLPAQPVVVTVDADEVVAILPEMVVLNTITVTFSIIEVHGAVVVVATLVAEHAEVV